MNDQICQEIINNNENNDDIIVDNDNKLIFCQQKDINNLHHYHHHTRPAIISSMATKTNNKTMKYSLINYLLLIICLILFSIVTLLVDARPIRSSISTFCQKPSNILQVYNIGRDVYLALNSRSIYRFDVDRLEVSETRFDLNRLFGTRKFQWVDTTINLNGICNVTQICPIGGNKELDHIHVVIGQRILPENNRVYGFALYEQVDSEQPSPINMINLAKLESQLSLFNRTGIHLNTLEQGGSIMMGPFWPSSNGNLYYRSGLYVPKHSQIFFSIYDNTNPKIQKLVYRNINEPNQWKDISDQLEGKFFIGMFNFAPKDRTFGLTEDNQVWEFVWNTNNNIKLVPKGSLREMLNCYDNSTELEKYAQTLTTPITTTSTTTTTTTTTTSTTTTTTEIPKKIPPFFKPPPFKDINEPKLIDDIDQNVKENENKDDDEDDDDINDIEEPNGSNDEFELPSKEKETNFNDLDHQRDDPNNANQPQNRPHMNKSKPHQHSSRNLAEASARGPFNPHQNDLIWALGILIAILIILTIIILIPILIIRHRSRNNHMNLNKQMKNGKPQNNSSSRKKNKANGLDQSTCAEQVKLMNSFNLEK